jgi:hypothetical protein
MSSASAVTVNPAARVRGRVRPPGDKSISHRYALLAALADGVSTIDGYSTGGDCASTLDCLRSLGVQISEVSRDPAAGLQLRVTGRGLGGLARSTGLLDASVSVFNHGRRFTARPPDAPDYRAAREDGGPDCIRQWTASSQDRRHAGSRRH